MFQHLLWLARSQRTSSHASLWKGS